MPFSMVNSCPCTPEARKNVLSHGEDCPTVESQPSSPVTAHNFDQSDATVLPCEAQAIEPTSTTTQFHSVTPPSVTPKTSNTAFFCSVPLDKVQSVLPPYTTEVKVNSARKVLCLYCDRTLSNTTLRHKHVERCHSSKQLRRVSLRKQQNHFTNTSCFYCDKLTLTEHTLKDLFEHLCTNHSNKYFGCLLCEDRFANHSQLTEHNTLNHKSMEKIDKEALIQMTDGLSVQLVDVGSIDIGKFTRSKLKEDNAAEESKKTVKGKKLSVKASRIILKRSKRIQAKVVDTHKKKRARTIDKKEKAIKNQDPVVGGKVGEKPAKPQSSINPYPEFDSFFQVKKITDHSIDNLKISSLTFDDVFDKAFFNRIRCNIQENLMHHLDGKLFKNEESESRISNFEKNSNLPQESQSMNTENYGCELSLNAVTPTTSLLSSQFGEDPESQIEYGSKPSKKKTPTKKDEVHYKYLTRRKYQASILEHKENRDLSKLDMWTQFVIKNRQQKIVDDQKSHKEILDYFSSEEYKSKIRREELNRILDRRGPFEDLKEEVTKRAAFDKLSLRPDTNLGEDSLAEVRDLLHDVLDKVFEMTESNTPKSSKAKPLDEETSPEIPSYLNLQRSSSLTSESEIDRSDRITLICSSQETENFELPTNTIRRKHEKVELTGEWARSRIYICAACGLKVLNMKQFLEHKSAAHQDVWLQQYEFVGNQSKLYKHLSIPVLGKVGYLEDTVQCKLWKRSDSRLCTKCGKVCNSLGELHRHVLECGGDWTWMLVRKKCKYRPYGAKSRRKRRGLVKRIYSQKTPPSDKKICKKVIEGPRPKPSDAESIQRMLANLPAKRATRKLICMKDGIHPNRNTQQAPAKTKIKCGKRIIKTNDSNEKHTITKKQRAEHRKSLRTLSKVLTSRIMDNNQIVVKRKYKKRVPNNEPVVNVDNIDIEPPKEPEVAEEIEETKTARRGSPRIKKQILENNAQKMSIKRYFPVKKKSNAKVAKITPVEKPIEPMELEVVKEVSNEVPEKSKKPTFGNIMRRLTLRKRKTDSQSDEPKDDVSKQPKSGIKRKLKNTFRDAVNKIKKLKTNPKVSNDKDVPETFLSVPQVEEVLPLSVEIPEVIASPVTLKRDVDIILPSPEMADEKPSPVSTEMNLNNNTKASSLSCNRKVRKPLRGLNDCIAMLTNKLSKNVDTPEPSIDDAVELPLLHDSVEKLKPEPERSGYILKVPSFTTQFQKSQEVEEQVPEEVNLVIPVVEKINHNSETLLHSNNDEVLPLGEPYLKTDEEINAEMNIVNIIDAVASKLEDAIPKSEESEDDEIPLSSLVKTDEKTLVSGELIHDHSQSKLVEPVEILKIPVLNKTSNEKPTRAKSKNKPQSKTKKRKTAEIQLDIVEDAPASTNLPLENEFDTNGSVDFNTTDEVSSEKTVNSPLSISIINKEPFKVAKKRRTYKSPANASPKLKVRKLVEESTQIEERKVVNTEEIVEINFNLANFNISEPEPSLFEKQVLNSSLVINPIELEPVAMESKELVVEDSKMEKINSEICKTIVCEDEPLAVSLVQFPKEVSEIYTAVKENCDSTVFSKLLPKRKLLRHTDNILDEALAEVTESERNRENLLVASELTNGKGPLSFNDSTSPNSSELLIDTSVKENIDEEPCNQRELRRSGRKSKKITSYNEIDVVDPIFDDFEKVQKFIQKTTALEQEDNRKTKKKPALKPSAEELFDMLKSPPEETIAVLPNPTNSFLTYDEISNDFDDDNLDVFENIIEKSMAVIEQNLSEPLMTNASLELPTKVDDLEIKDVEEKKDATKTNKRKKKVTTKRAKVQQIQEADSTSTNTDSIGDLPKVSVKNIYCEICDKSFCRTESLTKHKRTITHISKLSEIEARDNAIKNKEIEDEATSNTAEIKLIEDEAPNTNLSISDLLNVSETGTSKDFPASNCMTSSLKLADIINEVLNKPVDIDKHSFSNIILQASNVSEPEVKRCRSLGERKSFEEDKSFSPKDTQNYFEPQLSANSAGTIVEKQITLLESIIENRSPLDYIDDITACSIQSGNDNSRALETLPEPPVEVKCDSFLKPLTHYEEISEDSNMRSYEDPKSRKVLNRDEELFLECCSLLKGSSEVSNSNILKNGDRRDKIGEDNWLANRCLPEKRKFDVAETYSESSRDNFPEKSESNTISSNWNIGSVSSNGREDIEKRSFSFDEVFEKKEKLSSFGGVISDIFSMDNIKNRNGLSFDETSNSSMNLSPPGSQRSEEVSDASTSDSKKMLTKGAMKVFEGLRVSIPTEELNLPELLVNNNKQEVEMPLKKAKSTKRKPARFMKHKKHGMNSKSEHDVYDFEETQDNFDVFTKPDFRSFRSKSDKKRPEDSDDPICDTLSSSTSSVSEECASLSTAKTPNQNLTKKKCMIMGRIFKNAAKEKIDEDNRTELIPTVEKTVENKAIAEDLNNIEPIARKMTEDELNLAFDRLVSGENTTVSTGKSKLDHKSSLNKKKLKHRAKKRTNPEESDSTDDEFGLKRSPKKRTKRKNTKAEDNSINLEQEMKECIGVAGRKSQRKCTSGKQNVLIEYWSSDESSFEARIKQSEAMPANNIRRNREVVAVKPIKSPVIVEKRPVITKEPVFHEPEAPKAASEDSTKTKSAEINRRKRLAANPLYHWSSSSEDESRDLIEIKPIREELGDDDDRPIQHGWIVGDSPKKLVTMLAQAKGKKCDFDGVKEQGRKRTNMCS